MRKIVFCTALFIPLVAAGCASSQTQLHQSLLLQENRQLEDALFVAQAQVADLTRENNVLRTKRTGEFSGRSQTESWGDGFEVEPLIEMPRVILPSDSGTTEIPEALRGSQMFPIWMPQR